MKKSQNQVGAHFKHVGPGKRPRKPPKQVDPKGAQDGPAEHEVKSPEGPATLTSVWQTTEIAGFFQNAEQMQKEFTATRDVRLVSTGHKKLAGPTEVVQGTTAKPLTDHRSPAEFFDLSIRYLTVPRRPAWDYSLSKEIVEEREKVSFLQWRRELSEIEQKAKALLSPYERNLEVWRQLWRVVERSDIVFQIVDCRNPMCFRCVDFEKFVEEQGKKCVLLLNKADLLTEKQREAWTKYFASLGIRFLFFSAVAVDPHTEGEEEEKEEIPVTAHEKHLQERKSRRLKGTVDSNKASEIPEWVKAAAASGGDVSLKEKEKGKKKPEAEPKEERPPTQTELRRDERIREALKKGTQNVFNTSRVFSAQELLDLCVALRTQFVETGDRPVTVGMVGYPNVGKSSSINAILGQKKVVVSATPGKTKHMQTLVLPLERRIILCDCPGLVFPSFCITAEDMVCDGILPVATMKDFHAAVSLVTCRIPRIVFEACYNISLSREDDMDESQTPADRLLNALARRRGFMADHDKPVRSKAALIVLRDYVKGALVFVHPPPLYRPEGANDEDGEGGETWEDVEDENDEDAESASDDSYDESEDEEGVVSKKFFCPVMYPHKWALTSRKLEEDFNFGVNDSIVLNRNSKIDQKIAAKMDRDHALQKGDEKDSIIVDADGEIAFAVDAEDGIVCIEDETPETEVKQEAHLTKRQQRKLQKRNFQSDRKFKVDVPI